MAFDVLTVARQSPTSFLDRLFMIGAATTGLEEIKFADHKQLILFTSDRRNEAEQIYDSNPENYVLIHKTPLGGIFEELRLFDDMPGDIAYLAWYIIAERLITENSPKQVTIVGNPENTTSTLWNFELPLLLNTNFECEIRDEKGNIFSPDKLTKLCQPFFDEYVATRGLSGILADKWAKSGQSLPDLSIPEHQRIRALLLAMIRTPYRPAPNPAEHRRSLVS